MKVLVTGGAGYIGSTTISALRDAGFETVILDSLKTGQRVYAQRGAHYIGDVADRPLIRRIIAEHPDVDVTVHMAASTVVPESIADPVEYYRNNLVKSIVLFEELSQAGLARIVFSSSASVYDTAENFEVSELSSIAPMSPYARSKWMVEQVLADMSAAGLAQGISLRYFNPIGADPLMRTGPFVKNPSHVLGQLLKVALQEQSVFRLTGGSLPTRDGSGLRDFIHVWDLAEAHVAAVKKFSSIASEGSDRYSVLNLGTGSGVTVRELIQAVESVARVSIPVQVTDPRPGDAVGAFANVDRAKRVLEWSARLSIRDGIESALEWEQRRDSVLYGH